MAHTEHENQSLQISLTCLSHPFSLGAMALLLLNDHFFRILWPGWWTGKLGDIAWLFFFPFALAGLLAMILPKQISHHHRWIFNLAAGSTGVIFALGKTLPTFHASLIQLASFLFGWTVNWRLDPTDLVALVSLGSGVWLWGVVAQSQQKHSVPGWLLLSLSAILTVANSAYPPSEGIACLEIINEQVYAIASRQVYTSKNGGLTWESSDLRQIPCKSHFYEGAVTSTTSLDDPIKITDLANPAVIYQIRTGKYIQRSNDHGQTWTMEWHPQPPSQAVQAYLVKNNPGTSRFKDPPLDAVFDPRSGNLIFAMGYEGVLVRQADGSYTPVGVGIYQPAQPRLGSMLLTLIPGEAFMAFLFSGLGLLVMTSQGVQPIILRLAAYGTSLLWLIVSLVTPPALEGFGYGNTLRLIAFAIMGLALLPVMIWVFIRIGESSHALLKPSIQVFVIGGLLYLLPFIAWVVDILPSYRLAQLVGILLGCGWFYQQRSQSKKPDRESE